MPVFIMVKYRVDFAVISSDSGKNLVPFGEDSTWTGYLI